MVRPRVIFPQFGILPGENPIVIVGPNGSGKTRLGHQLAQLNNAGRVAALRNIALQPDVPMRSLPQAKQQLDKTRRRVQSEWWQLSGEINELFAKLMAEDSASAIEFRNEYINDRATEPGLTKLMRLQESWSRLFPGRRVDFAGHQPIAQSEYQGGSRYPAQQMSDGERVALYLAARVLDCENATLIVDEPELHFHSLLASKFWTEMEALRPDCRFIYITHDLPFALSRRDPDYVLVHAGSETELLALDRALPIEVARSILSAASFSIYARRVVFCEGAEGSSIDSDLYSSWFNDQDTAVVPVGNCTAVVQCASAFSRSRIVSGLDAVGIVDRDHSCDSYLESLPENVSVLKVHECENLLATRSVLNAVATHLGADSNVFEQNYRAFRTRVESLMTEEFLAKLISERFRSRCEHEFRSELRGLTIDGDLEAQRKAHVHALDPTHWGVPVDEIYAEESKRIASALAGSEQELMQVVPGKSLIRLAADVVQLRPDALLNLVCRALRAANTGDALRGLGAALEEALAPHLPARRFAVEEQEAG